MSTKKGNIRDLLGKKTAGRPPKYEDYEEMHQKIWEYLEWEEATSKGKFTVEGCALWLGFASRQSMYDYKDKSPEFSYTMGRFLLFMKHYHAQRLTWAGSFQGSKFWLTNFGGYTEESTQNVNQTVTEVKPEVISGTPKIEEKE